MSAAPPAQAASNEDGVAVPHDALDPATLRALIESFVLREGTDYGERELGLEEKVSRLRRLLERGEARILFDPETSTVTIVPAAPKQRGTAA